MTDLLTHLIVDITNSQDFPPVAAVDHVALAPRQITIWRILSKDDDEYAEVSGLLHSETADLWNLILPDDPRVTSFPKTTPRGVAVWRRA